MTSRSNQAIKLKSVTCRIWIEEEDGLIKIPYENSRKIKHQLHNDCI
jgi:hypothetical protein